MQEGTQNMVRSVAVSDINQALGSFMDTIGQATGAAGDGGPPAARGTSSSGGQTTSGVSRNAPLRRTPGTNSWTSTGTGAGTEEPASPGSPGSIPVPPVVDSGELVAEPAMPVRRAPRRNNKPKRAADPKPSNRAGVRQQTEDAPNFSGERGALARLLWVSMPCMRALRCPSPFRTCSAAARPVHACRHAYRWACVGTSAGT